MIENWKALAFEERQKEWSGFEREFRQSHGRGKRPYVWKISVTGNRYTITHGQLDGAMQVTTICGKAKNKNKANEITAEQDALAEARRECRKRYDFEGYDEYVGNTNIDKRNEDVSVQHLLTALPGSFCLYKPENNFWDQKKLVEKARKGEVLYSLKRDGMAKIIVIDYYGNVNMYSRRSRPWHDKEAPKEALDGSIDYSTARYWAERFPHLIEAVKRLQLPPGSMMACELIFTGANGLDDFKYVSQLTKSMTDDAIQLQKDVGPAMLYWWDVPFYGGEDMFQRPVIERYGLITHHWSTGVDVVHQIQPIQYCNFNSPEEAVEHAKKTGLEGWVVVDPDAIYGDKGWNVKGKPDRPSTSAKLKPKYEDDFIAKWDPDKGKLNGEWGTGKHERGKKVQLPDGSTVIHGGVGCMSLYQLDADGKEVYISDCASGMSYDFQAKLQPSDFPMVVQVEYTERTYISDGEKTNALRFPVFLRKRTDKRPEECVNSRL